MNALLDTLADWRDALSDRLPQGGIAKALATLLGLYLLLTAGFFMTLKMFLCTQCMNFACPLNGVPDPVRVKFFECNPVVADAWNHNSKA